MPGSGKSTYSDWLRREKGADHVDTDGLINKQPFERTPLEQGWCATFTRQVTPAAFMNLVMIVAALATSGLWAASYWLARTTRKWRDESEHLISAAEKQAGYPVRSGNGLSLGFTGNPNSPENQSCNGTLILK